MPYLLAYIELGVLEGFYTWGMPQRMFTPSTSGIGCEAFV